jgi:hypothetical protein
MLPQTWVRTVNRQFGSVFHSETIVDDPGVVGPVTMAIVCDGYLDFTANQLHPQSGYNGCKNLRVIPFSVCRMKINGVPVRLR